MLSALSHSCSPLPFFSELFDSVDAPSFFAGGKKDEAPAPVAVKVKAKAQKGGGASMLSKKRPRPSGILAPPQIRSGRANITTEDTTSWTTQRKEGAKQKAAAAAAGGGGAAGKSKSFRQKEKRKRDLGQSSRGKSYVEEEKRILRESGY